MHNISNKFIFSRKIGFYRTYLRNISEKEYNINGNIEYIYVLKGQLTIETSNKLSRLGEKDIYVVEPWKDIIIDSDSENIILIVQLIPEALKDYHLLNYKYIYTGMVLSDQVRVRIASNIKILLKHKLRDKYTDDIIIKAVEGLIRDVKIDLELDSTNPNSGDMNMRNIIVSITRELPGRIVRGEDTRLKTLSEEYNISYYHLSKSFKDITGVTYTNYLSHIQMNIFLDMLLNEDRNITNMALKAGYRNISNLNKDFKKFFDMSPTELRKKYGEESKDPVYDIKEVRDFLGEVNMLEEFYLNGEVVVDFRSENQFTDRTMELDDIKTSIVRVKKFIENFERIRVRMVVNYSDYRHVLALEDEKLMVFLSQEIKKIIDICVDRRIELSVDYKI